jgi:hypothetical protein
VATALGRAAHWIVRRVPAGASRQPSAEDAWLVPVVPVYVARAAGAQCAQRVPEAVEKVNAAPDGIR